MCDNNDMFVNFSKAMKIGIDSSYLNQLKTISNPPWRKNMQLISETIKSDYARLAIPKELLAEMRRVATIQVPQIHTKELVEAIKPFYGTESLIKPIDVSSVTAGMAESLTALSSAAAIIADSRSSIEKISNGLSKSIPNLFGDCDFGAVVKKVVEQNNAYNDDFADVQDSFEWDDIQFSDNEVEYQGIVVTKEDVNHFVSTNTEYEDFADEQKKKFSLISKIVSIIITVMALLDIPGNWTIQEVTQYVIESKELHNNQYSVCKDFVDVYMHPEMSSEKVDCLPYGTIIDAVEEDELWIKITILSPDNGMPLEGWVQKAKINKYSPDKTEE